jgi:hypothetical protein
MADAMSFFVSQKTSIGRIVPEYAVGIPNPYKSIVVAKNTLAAIVAKAIAAIK